MFAPLPSHAVWQHVGVRTGLELATFEVDDHGCQLRGTTVAVEDEDAWAVGYDIAVDPLWRTTSARVRTLGPSGEHEIEVRVDPDGRWLVDGTPRPDLDGCVDVDLESSACTNTLPVHRLGLAVGDASAAPAVFVRAADLAAERLEQRYRRVGPDEEHQRSFDYEAPAFEVRVRLTYDAAGLVVDYPGLAARAR